jgi:N-carbamoyl-L-amino-acid hydrolase
VRLSSGAGHDASLMAGIAPAGMIFVRTKDGRSHCPEEYAAPADINGAVDALAYAVLEIDALQEDLVV